MVAMEYVDLHHQVALTNGLVVKVNIQQPDILENTMAHYMPAVAVALLHILGMVIMVILKKIIKLALEEQEVVEMLFLQEIVELEAGEVQDYHQKKIFVALVDLVYVLYVGMIRSLKRKEESA